MITGRQRARPARVGKLPLQKSQRVHNALPPERHMPASRRVPSFSEQLPGRVPARPGLIFECAATRVERATQTHSQADPADHRPGDISHDPAEHSRRHLPRKRPLRPGQHKLMGSQYDPRKPTSYIKEVDANNLYGWVMSQEMPDGNFKWLSVDECRDMEQLLNYADNRIAIFDTGLFDHQENEEDKKSFIFEVDLEYPPEVHERDDDYPLVPEVMTTVPEITGEKQHNLRAQYFGAACP